MAERRQGPVKPPVIDLKPNVVSSEPAQETVQEPAPEPIQDVAADAPPEAHVEATPEPAAPETPPEAATEPAPVAPELPNASGEPIPAADQPAPEQPAEAHKPAVGATAAPTAPPPPPWLAIGGGALLGTALTLVLAALGWLPIKTQDAGADIAALQTRLAALEQAAPADPAADAAAQVAALKSELAPQLSAASEGLAALRAQVEAQPAAPAADTEALQAQLKALSDRLDAMAAGAADPADATALNQTIEALQQGLAQLGTRLDALQAHDAEADRALASLGDSLKKVEAGLGEAQQAIAHPETSPVAQMPLVLSGLEDAFANGRSFTTELNSLRLIAPDAQVPQGLADAAATGLSRPEILAAHFAELLPAIIAAKPGDPEASWQDAALDWMKSALALRPAEEQAGATPEALVSQLEAAMGRRDYAAAAAILGQLPAPMQAAAEDLPQQLQVHAEAGAFLLALREKALAATSEVAP